MRTARKARGLSQSQLGARIGAHVTSISDWERGDNAPSGRHVASLSRELGVPAEMFYADDDEETASMEPLARDLASALRAEVERLVSRALQANTTLSKGRQ